MPFFSDDHNELICSYPVEILKDEVFSALTLELCF